MSLTVTLPVLVPLGGAVIGLLAWRSSRLQRAIAVVTVTGLLAASALLLHDVRSQGVLTAAFGDWPAPFAIVFVADALSASLVALAGLMGLASILYAIASVDRDREALGYYPLTMILLAGVCGAFLTGDLFNLFVWFEVLLITSFVLVVLGGSRREYEGGLTYVIINLLASALFLTGLGLVYGFAGTLNMAELATRLPAVEQAGLVQATSMLFLISFGIKAAVFPLFFWLPSAYTAPPVASSALFAGLLTKVGVYALLRMFTLVFTGDAGLTSTLLLWIAGATMLVGVLGAMAQDDIPHILAFHSVSQVGYMVMGLAIGTPLALAGALFFIVHHSIVKGNLFLVGGLAERAGGSMRLEQLGGLSARPGLAALFLVPALSLAGLPPLSGFWAKVTLVLAGLQAEAYAIVVVALATGVLTLLSMTKIWSEAFWKPGPVVPEHPVTPLATSLLGPAILLAVLAVVLGVAAEPLLDLALLAAEGLLDPQGYIEAVLGGVR